MSKESKETKQGALGPNQRWSVRRKREVVLRLLHGEPLDATGDPRQAELDKAMRRIGEMSMENEVLRRQCELHRPFVKRRSRK